MILLSASQRRCLCLRAISAGIFSCLIAFPAAAQQKDTDFSGPQPGEQLSGFKVLQILTPEDAKEVEVAQGKEPVTLIMFMHKLSEPAIGLMINIEWYASKQKGIDDLYILLTDDRTKSESMAKRWARRPFFSAAPMSISLDGLEGPGRYGLNRHMDMTVLVAKKNKVVANFAINAPNNTDAPKILKTLAEAAGQKPPSFETIRAEIRAERQRRRNRNLENNPIYKLAPNPELGRLVIAMIQGEGINESVVEEVSTRITNWVDNNDARRKMIANYSAKLLKGNFEINRYARAALRKFAELPEK